MTMRANSIDYDAPKSTRTKTHDHFHAPDYQNRWPKPLPPATDWPGV